MIDKQLATLTEARKIGITSLTMMSALLILSKSKDGMNLKEVAKSIGTTAAAVTGISDRMERLGLAKRFFDGSDRRFVILSITKKGTKFVERMCNP